VPENSPTNTSAMISMINIIITCAVALSLLFSTNHNVIFGQQQQTPEEQGENDTDLAGLSTTITVKETMVNESTANQQTRSTEIGEIEDPTLASANFAPLRENLATIYDALHNNDPDTVYNALNSADESLFALVASGERVSGGGEGTTITTTATIAGQLNSLQKHIGAARDALRDGNNVKTMEEANTVGSGLFNITQSLAQD
jgi:hypothetical protein